jgi:hypothetical protein
MPHLACFIKTELMEYALLKTMNDLIARNTYVTESTSITLPFAFGYSTDINGRPKIGRGTNEDPTLVGITTRALLGNFGLADACTMHVDATFKFTQHTFL